MLQCTIHTATIQSEEMSDEESITDWIDSEWNDDEDEYEESYFRATSVGSDSDYQRSSRDNEREGPAEIVTGSVPLPQLPSTETSKLASRKKTEMRKKAKDVKSGAYLHKLIASGCCKKKCVSEVLTPEEIEMSLKDCWDASEEDHRRFVLDFFYISHKVDEGGKYTYKYEMHGKKVCQGAWKLSHGISNGRFHNLRRDFEKGRRNPVSNRVGRAVKSRRMLDAQLWFDMFITSMGDRMPDDAKMHLPSCQTKLHVYKTYREEMITKKGRLPISYTQFRRMWSRNYKYVVIPKVNRFTKCGVCTLIKENLHNLKNKQRRLSWIEMKNFHLSQQALERKKYYKHQVKARQRPHKYLSLIIDGMDQAKTNIPHFYITSKIEGQHAGFLKAHVTGALSHGSNMAFCLLDLMRWPQDANGTINIMLETLAKIKMKNGSLPPVLYWQMDNCFRDCKNIYIFGFCALLVMANVFRKIRLSYLIVGHTHEDVDQMFSRISVALRKLNATTLDALRDVIRNSYTPTPSTIYIENIYDVKSWIQPYTSTFKNHSHPHAFRFKKNLKGEVEMKYRRLANAGQEWQPVDSPFVIMKEMPHGNPAVLRPEHRKCPTTEEMRSAIQHLTKRLTRADVEWWNKFISEERNKRAMWDQMTDQDYQEAGRCFNLAALRCNEYLSEDESDDEEIVRAEDNLLKVINKSAEHPPVQQVRTAGGKENRKVRTKNSRGTDDVPRKKKKAS